MEDSFERSFTRVCQLLLEIEVEENPNVIASLHSQALSGVDTIVKDRYAEFVDKQSEGRVSALNDDRVRAQGGI